MDEHTAANAATHPAAHAAAHGAEHAPHELPNIFGLLHKVFPESPLTQFLHQWETVIFTLLAAAIITLIFGVAGKRREMIPSGLQNFCEALTEGLSGLVTGLLGHHGPKHFPFLATIFVYLLLMNWTGIVPFMKSPTSMWSTTLAIGLTTMIYVQYHGIKEQGFVRYVKHMAGNPQNMIGLFLIPLMLPINFILELLAMPFSLSLRLFANVSSEDRLLFNFAGIGLNSPFYIGFVFQLFGNMLAILFSVIQAFVFMLLTTVYLSLILPHDDHHEETPEGGEGEPLAPGPLNISTNPKGVH